MRSRKAIGTLVALLAPLIAAPQLSAAAGADGTASAAGTPRWVLHAQRYPGGISNGVRASLAAAKANAAARQQLSAAPLGAAVVPPGGNVQMNDDTNPPMPQNETAVAVNLDNPRIAVAGANDYVSGGVAVMRTVDGGRSWRTVRVVPVFRPSSDACSGGDPALAYSRRDRAFYLSQLCFFRIAPFSEVQVFKSVDNGRTWTPGRRSAVPVSNFDPETGAVDESVFHDKEWLTVDNTPTSPFYGRLYVTWTKFHIAADGSSDFCPIQLAYTDSVPTFDPSLAVWQHTKVVPDRPGTGGLGESANQFSVPQVGPDGVLGISYVIEECNTALDHGNRYQRSTDGGQTFLPRPVRIDKPGQFRDNPDLGDQLPPTKHRAPGTSAQAISPRTGTVVYVYQNNINRRVSGADISVSRSTDGGLSWGDARTLSHTSSGAAARNDQYFPWVTADEKGVFHAVWFDRRLDPANRLLDTWYGWSTDDGRSWKTRRISTKSWNPDRGFFKSGAFIGDYNGIAAWGGFVYPVWTDGRNNAIARTGLGETDVFTAVIRR